MMVAPVWITGLSGDGRPAPSWPELTTDVGGIQPCAGGRGEDEASPMPVRPGADALVVEIIQLPDAITYQGALG